MLNVDPAGEQRLAVTKTSRTGPHGRKSVEVDANLPADVFEVLVSALAEALVLDFQEDTRSMVASPGGKDHDSHAGSA